MNDPATGSISVETSDLNVDIEMKKSEAKPLQEGEKSSKMDVPLHKDS